MDASSSQSVRDTDSIFPEIPHQLRAFHFPNESLARKVLWEEVFKQPGLTSGRGYIIVRKMTACHVTRAWRQSWRKRCHGLQMLMQRLPIRVTQTGKMPLSDSQRMKHRVVTKKRSWKLKLYQHQPLMLQCAFPPSIKKIAWSVANVS